MSVSTNNDSATLMPLRNRLRDCRKLTLFCCGNPARADDGVGCLFASLLQTGIADRVYGDDIRVVCDMQWQIEDALEFRPDGLALFVDCSLRCRDLWSLTSITDPLAPTSGSHSLSPQQLLWVADRIGTPRPHSVWLLAFEGRDFTLGKSISDLLRKQVSVLAHEVLDIIEKWQAEAACRY